MVFGEKLQLLRKSKNMTQEQLATKIKVSRQAISKWELGESMPDIDKVLLLSKTFGVSTDYLLNDEIENYIDTSSLKEHNFRIEDNSWNKRLVTVGILLSGIGILGNLVIWILSTMIKVHVTKSEIMPDGTILYYGGGDVLGYDYWSFISEYRLMAILIILTVSFIAGIALLFFNFNKHNEKLINIMRKK